MRTPVRSESDAFRVALGGALAIGVALLIGWLITPVVGAVIFAVTLVVAAAAYLRATRSDRRAVLHDAEVEPHPHGAPAGTRHVLVVANTALGGDELLTRIAGRNGEHVEVDILAPVLASRMHYGVSDVDRELGEARTRLDHSLAWAHAQGITARGEVGDPSPTTAIEDELRDFGADEVIVVTHPRDRETWQERGELERLRQELQVPITHVVVGGGEASAPSR